VGRSSPYYEDQWRRYCCFTSFFPIVDMCLSCKDMARQSCAIVPRWRFFDDFLLPVFSASRLQHVSDLHSKFALRPHHVWKYGRHPIIGCLPYFHTWCGLGANLECISNLRRLRLGEERKNRRTRRRAVTLPRRETRWNLQGCLKLLDRSQPLLGRRSPYCGDMWRTYRCLTSFFPIVDACLSCEDRAR